MAGRTIQVQQFYQAAKSIGLKRGDFTAKSPKDKYGEYKEMEVVIYANLTEAQVRQLAQNYKISVYQLNGQIGWNRPSIHCSGKPGIELWNLDEKDNHGLHPVTRLA